MTDDPYTLGRLIREDLLLSHWEGHPQLVKKLIVEKKEGEYVAKILSLPYWKDYPQLLEMLIQEAGPCGCL